MWLLTGRNEPIGRLGLRDPATAGIAVGPDPAAIHDPDHDRRVHRMTEEHHDTVVVDDRGSGSGMGMILGIIAIVVLLVAVWYFAIGPGASSSGSTNTGGDNPPAATEQAPAAPSEAPAAS
jgi:hypothetical protein